MKKWAITMVLAMAFVSLASAITIENAADDRWAREFNSRLDLKEYKDALELLSKVMWGDADVYPSWTFRYSVAAAAVTKIDSDLAELETTRKGLEERPDPSGESEKNLAAKTDELTSLRGQFENFQKSFAAWDNLRSALFSFRNELKFSETEEVARIRASKLPDIVPDYVAATVMLFGESPQGIDEAGKELATTCWAIKGMEEKFGKAKEFSDAIASIEAVSKNVSLGTLSGIIKESDASVALSRAYSEEVKKQEPAPPVALADSSPSTSSANIDFDEVGTPPPPEIRYGEETPPPKEETTSPLPEKPSEPAKAPLADTNAPSLLAKEETTSTFSETEAGTSSGAGTETPPPANTNNAPPANESAAGNPPPSNEANESADNTATAPGSETSPPGEGSAPEEGSAQNQSPAENKEPAPETETPSPAEVDQGFSDEEWGEVRNLADDYREMLGHASLAEINSFGDRPAANPEEELAITFALLKSAEAYAKNSYTDKASLAIIKTLRRYDNSADKGWYRRQYQKLAEDGDRYAQAFLSEHPN